MFITCQPESCLHHCIEGVSEVDDNSIDSLSLSVGFMHDEMHFLQVDVHSSTLPASNLPWFKQICLFHDPFQPLDDVVERLIPTVEQHYQSLIRRFVGAASSVELRDGAIHGGQALASCVNGFLGQRQYFIHPRLHNQ